MKTSIRSSNICVTIANQRSGTKLLGDCFNKGIEALSLGEIFNDQGKSIITFKNFIGRSANFGEIYASGKVFDLLDQYFNELGSLYKFVHFDLMYNNLHFSSPLWWDSPKQLPLIEYFKSREFSIIHLTRDLRDSYISQINAKELGIFHTTLDYIPNHSNSHNFETRDGNHIQELVNQFTNYSKNTTDFQKITNSGFIGYPYYCNLQYEELLDSNGMLRDKIRQKLSRFILNDCNINSIQLFPTSLTISPKTEFANQIKAKL